MIINAYDKEFEFVPDIKGKHFIIINDKIIPGYFKEEYFNDRVGFKNGEYSYIQEMYDLSN